MQLALSTTVNGTIQQVFNGFNQDLFLQLNPPFPPVRVLRFDGTQIGDEVHLELNFLFFRQIWISHITAFETTETEILFVDEGRQLPFFLTSWRHRHRVVATETGTVIIDEIRFTSPNRLLDLVLLPTLYLQFLYRKPIYKRFFRTFHDD